MEPITVIVVGLFCFVRYGVTDAIAAARGTEPGRVAARRERHERRAARTGPSVTSALAARIAGWLDPSTSRHAKDGPLRRYLAALWRDSWEHAGEVHARREAQRQAGQLPRQRFGRWATDQARAWWQSRGPQRVGSSRDDRCEFCTDPSCRGECVEPADWDEEPPARPEAEPTPTEPDRPPRPAPTPPSPPEATVHPIRPEGPTMTTATKLDGETYNPETGMAYAEGIAANQASVAESCETSQASLAGHVDGEAVALLGSIQEHCDAAKADAEKLRAVFQQHAEVADTAAAAGVKDETYLHA